MLLSHPQLPRKGQRISITRETPLPPLQYLILECYPFFQGILSPNTNVILLPPNPVYLNQFQTVQLSNTTAATPTRRKPLIMRSSIIPALDGLSEDYDKILDITPTTTGIIESANRNRKLLLRPSILPYGAITKMMNGFQRIRRDEAIEIGVTMQTLRRIGVFHSNLVSNTISNNLSFNSYYFHY